MLRNLVDDTIVFPEENKVPYKYSELENKVNNKRKEIEELKHVTKDVLESILPSDIITYCIYPLF